MMSALKHWQNWPINVNGNPIYLLQVTELLDIKLPREHRNPLVHDAVCNIIAFMEVQSNFEFKGNF